MFHVLVFLHVSSSVLLGSFVSLPLMTRRIILVSDSERRGYLIALASYTRVGHYALILLLLTGVGLMLNSSHKPSVLWDVCAFVLLLMIAAMIGVISRKLKALIGSASQSDSIAEYAQNTTIYSWIATACIIAEIIVMTSR